MANKRISDLPAETDPASTDVVAIDGATTRKATRANLLKENLEAIRGLTSAADKGIQFTGSGTAATYDLTTAGKALLDDADASAQRTTLGLAIGTDVQAYDASLADVAGVTFAQGDVLYHNGTNLVALGPGTSGNFLKTQGAGANPTWDSIPGGGDLLSANNLSDVASAATSRSNLQVGIKGYLYGLTLSTAGSSATFGVAAGEATGVVGLNLLVLASSYTKTTSAWAVGTGNGALDTGTIANSTWYHVHLIKRTDTGVVDVLISTSATAPTLPTNYTLFRRIGSLLTNGSAQWVKFSQVGDEFLWDAPVADIAGVATGTSGSLQALTVPPGVSVTALFTGAMVSNTAGTLSLYQCPDQANQTANTPTGNYHLFVQVTNMAASGQFAIRTNTSKQIRIVSNATVATCTVYAATQGYLDRRGRDS